MNLQFQPTVGIATRSQDLLRCRSGCQLTPSKDHSMAPSPRPCSLTPLEGTPFFPSVGEDPHWYVLVG